MARTTAERLIIIDAMQSQKGKTNNRTIGELESNESNRINRIEGIEYRYMDGAKPTLLLTL